MPDARSEYTERRAARTTAHSVEEQRHWRVGTARLIGFGMTLALGLGMIGGASYQAWWLLIPFVGVFCLGIWLDRIEATRARLRRAITIYKHGLARLDGKWSGTGSNGAQFAATTSHLYAADLDLFGDGSIFQLLCRARTSMGEAMLADWLLTPATPAVIAQRQHAVDELVHHLDLREDLSVLGDEERGGVDHAALHAWAKRPPMFDPKWYHVMAQVATPAAALALVALVVFLLAVGRSLDLTESVLTALRWYIIAVLGVTAVISTRFMRTAARISVAANAATRDIALLLGVLLRLEAEQFNTPYLAETRAKLDVNGERPSKHLKRLARLIELTHSRRNMIARLFWFFLAIDVHLAHAIERWRLTSGQALRRWLDAVGEFEALSSLATYRFERPNYVWPEISGQDAAFETTAIAHPLLGLDAVANDIHLDSELQLLIVSGSNMSGKSTLLRTIGISAALAQAGAPVRAKCLRMSPLAIGASIQINDSIQVGNSRFYAEVNRLHAIISAASTSTPLIFLIDECLHGTNSHDRRIGAAAIVRTLLDRCAIGLVTTHDLALTEITETFGARAANVHFVDHLDDGHLSFDYTMRPGVVQKSNAVALMRSVGIDV